MSTGLHSASRLADLDVAAVRTVVGDPDATRTVYTTVVVLAVLGVLLVALAVWLHRRTRPDRELLAPLEEMQTRRWRRRDPATQLRLLDEARPAAAEPLKRSVSVPRYDADFAADRPVSDFADLAEGAQGAEGATSSEVDPTPIAPEMSFDDFSVNDDGPGAGPDADAVRDATGEVDEIADGSASVERAFDPPSPDDEPAIVDPTPASSAPEQTLDPAAGPELVGQQRLDVGELPMPSGPSDEDDTDETERSDHFMSPARVLSDPTLFDTGSIPVVPGEGLLRHPGKPPG